MMSCQGQAREPVGCGFALHPSGVSITTTAIGFCALALLAGAAGASKAAPAENQLTWGVHGSLAPTWFDPAEMSGIVTPYMVFIDALLGRQAEELDATKRAALLGKIQEPVNERTIHAHIWQLAFLNGAGPRVGESGLGLIAGTLTRRPTRMSRWRTSSEGETP